MLKKFFVLIVIAQLAFLTQACASFNRAPARALDVYDCAAGFKDDKFVMEEFEKCIAADGVRLEVHGIVPEQRIAVVTFRNTNNFFSFINLSFLATTPELRAEIFKLNRHDVIIAKGTLIEKQLPQKHFRSSSFTIEKKSTSSEELNDYPYQAKLPDDLLKGDQFTGLVHAIYGEGSVLVVEYKDAVVPVFVESKFTAYTKDLYRSDMVEMFYEIQESPGRPVHLNLKQPAAPQVPLRITESMIAQHGQKVKLTGTLAMFPKSPMVMFNVFAMRRDIGHGLHRYYTLVNFDDAKVFAAIRAKLQTIWDAQATTKVKDRNKWQNPEIEIVAEGTLNVQDPNQANPQILLESIDSVNLVN
ncbi:MAG: hypothetical protein AABZ31_14255 [Bdellovibrionota bacterium]